MNTKILSAMLLTLLLSPLALAKSADRESERKHYRCHLRLSDNSEVIHEFVSVGKTRSEFLQGLAGRMVYSADGVNGSAVENVYQCVTAGQSFKAQRARELEAKTPF